ncbi:Uncharacterised protein [Halioglobus japonicus]|nr:Uncharacterised protein [Halioglobus japonicus]
MKPPVEYCFSIDTTGEHACTSPTQKLDLNIQYVLSAFKYL